MNGTSWRLVQYAVGWGIGLWLIGYVLGIVLFTVVPTALIGWIITPVGVALAVAVLLRIGREPLWFYAMLGAVWAPLAVLLDYVFIVKAFAPADGYYKPDVYLYYVLTFLLPLIVGALHDRAIRKTGYRAATFSNSDTGASGATGKW